ncbi:d-xylulose kinase [Moniliophthora roreri MCA 2997]|uniref:D-xylulose kinase n=1 Tax=Moniliophthora roreri (strain MCA 2997) TaxID=1381753 RepID=V2XDN3_MONRO|nr:d-xylulose kinase [Moniliophthora roreri MCA 2997]
MASKFGGPLFLGVELAVDQIRATVVDENLELVGVECVDFDTELPEYQTTGGIFTTPGEAYTTPVEMWIKALDMLLHKLHQTSFISRIKAISGCAQHALVWWKSTSIPSLSSLDPHAPFYNHFPAPSFSLPNTPTAQDTSSHTHALAIEALLGGPDRMAQRVGTCATASLVAAQLLRVREIWPQEVWSRTGRVQLASAFLASLISGKWVPMSESEACATGIWVHNPNAAGFWDENVLDIVGGSREEGRRVRGWLGEVDTSGGARKIGNVSRYLVERFGFEADTIVTPFTSDYLATYLSLCPSPCDAVLSFGPMDSLMTPAVSYLPTRLYNLYPHPAQEPGERKRYVAVLTSRNADVPRALVRDMYTKSWSAFDRLVAIVPPGGSIGLDDKLFSYWHLQGDMYPLERVKGIYRFETGVKVQEFRDLRANPRCLVESQILSFRVRWGRMVGTGIFGATTPQSTAPITSSSTPPPQPSTPLLPPSTPAQPTLLSPTSPYLPFVPTNLTPPHLPKRILSTGAAANFPAISNIVGDVFNAPVYVPATQVDGVQLPWGSPQRNAPGKGYPARAGIGMAWVGRWVWSRLGTSGVAPGPGVVGGGRSRSASVSTTGTQTPVSDRVASPSWGRGGVAAATTTTTFEDEMRKILVRRWVMSGQTWARTSVGSPATTGGQMPSNLIGGQHHSKVGIPNTSGSASTSGTSGNTAPGTPTTTMPTGGIGIFGTSSSGPTTPLSSVPRGLGSSVVVEEEEDELGPLRQAQYAAAVTTPSSLTPSGSGFSTSTSGSGSAWSVSSGSTGFTTPDLSISGSAMGLSGLGLAGLSNSNGIPNAGSNGSLANGQPGNPSATTPNAASSSSTSGTTNPTPLTPVVALQTGESEGQMGLAKVAEPDVDAFLTYAALVPEYCRLEGMLIKGVV